jgi:SAM-dependent methyltransferase
MAFSAEWLSLREPADRAARDGALARRAARAAGPTPLVVDLGCGIGASWRALAPFLPEGTRWRFVDHDPELLARAGAAAGDVAELVRADLGALGSLPLRDATLVTASALLDLVSGAWLAELARRLRAPFYAALSYDGCMRWTPEDPQDTPVTAAFNRHQRTDKGFGPALGPDAPRCGPAILRDAGFTVTTAESSWQLDGSMAPLQRELIGGIAAAAAQAGAADAPSWGRRRHATADRGTCHIGHGDLLALPANPPPEASRAGR